MNNTSIVDQLIYQIITRKKEVLFGLAAIIIGYWLFFFIANFGFIYIESSRKDIAITEIYSSSDRAVQKTAGIGPVRIAPRDIKSIIVTNGDSIKTQTNLSMPWYGYAHKKVRLAYDKNADKLAYNNVINATCSTYSKRLDKLSYYTCQKSKALFRYETPADGRWSTSKVADIDYSGDEIKPFMGGVIGFTHQSGSDVIFQGNIAFTSDSGQVTFYKSPPDLPESSLIRAKILTDQAHPDNNRLAIIDTLTGDLYLGTLTQNNSKIEFKHIAAPERFNPDYNQTLCTISNERVFCYYGLSSIGDSSPGDIKERLPNDIIKTYSFDNEAIEESRTIDKNLILSGLYATYDGLLYGKSYKKLFAFKPSDNKYNVKELSQNVDAVAAGMSMYFVQDNGIFEINPQTDDAYQIFYSKNIIPKTLYAADEKIFFTAGVPEVESATYAYSINSQDNTTPGQRPIDLLPMPSGDLPDTLTNDLTGNIISITVKMNRNFDRTIYESRKLAIIEALQSRGINTQTTPVIFNY